MRGMGSGLGLWAHQPRKSSPNDQDWLKAVGRFIAWFAPNCEATVTGSVSLLVTRTCLCFTQVGTLAVACHASLSVRKHCDWRAHL